MATDTTLAETALSMLREALLSGEIPAGSSIKEADVCARCGVSRTPARFALNALHREGLLDYLPQRGYRARRFDPESALHAYLIRSEVEGLACRMAAKEEDLPFVVQVLEACVEEGRQLLVDAPRKGFDSAAWTAMNVEFHKAILSSLHSEVFNEVIAYLERVPMAASRSLPISRLKPDPMLMRLAQDDHEKITVALKNRQGTRASRIMREHLARGGALVRDLMTQPRPHINALAV